MNATNTLELSSVDHGQLVRPAGGAHPVTVWDNAPVVMRRLYCKNKKNKLTCSTCGYTEFLLVHYNIK